MLRFVVLCIFAFFMSCQKQETPSIPEIQKAPILEDHFDKTGFILVPNVKGIKIEGSEIEKQGDYTTASELKIIDSQSGKIIDEFSSLHWGDLKFKSENDLFVLLLAHNALTLTYSSDGSKITKKTECNFLNIPDSSQFDKTLALTKVQDLDWEEFFYKLSNLAMKGDKRSYNFFIHPSDSGKILHKHSDGAASITPIIHTLQFMEQNGCKW